MALNWLSWLQETDTDAWLVLMKYFEPVIKMRSLYPQIHRDEWFNKAIHKKYGVWVAPNRFGNYKVRYSLEDIERKKPMSAYYVKYLNHDSDFAHCGLSERAKPVNLHGVMVHSRGDPDWVNGGWSRDHFVISLNSRTKDEIFDAIKDNIKVYKSWSKPRLIKALLSH